jgi:CRISPR-associated protein Cmr3
MKFKIDAVDTLKFGVGKLSSWSGGSFSSGMFPPFPTVIRGALRAAWLYEHGSAEIADTDDDPTKSYTVKEYALLLNDLPHFPVPADMVWYKAKNRLVQCDLMPNDGLSSLPEQIPYQLMANAEGKVEPASRRYVSRDGLTAYLNGDYPTDSVSLDNYVMDETKTGIYIDRKTGTVKEGRLYSTPMTRLVNASIAVNLEGAETGGLLRFGGEGKTASFTGCGAEISPMAPNEAANSEGWFKLYMATPGIFNGGHLPVLPVKAELIAAAVNGYDITGGYDIRAGKPKPVHRAVKAGSVYYYRLIENSKRDLDELQKLHGTSISDCYREDGFGICYLGKVQEGRRDV